MLPGMISTPESNPLAKSEDVKKLIGTVNESPFFQGGTTGGWPDDRCPHGFSHNYPPPIPPWKRGDNSDREACQLMQQIFQGLRVTEPRPPGIRHYAGSERTGSGGSFFQKAKEEEDETEAFEDDLLVLTRLSEQVMTNQLSLRSFRCREVVSVTERDSKSTQLTRREFVNAYQVKRKAETRVNAQLTFVETRTPQNVGKDDELLSAINFPTLENPFSGFIIQSFSFENRLANDFKKMSKEPVSGRDCLKFGFETVPQLSTSLISVMGNQTALRQRGFVWVDAETNRLVRLSARLTRLPKGCKAYEYQVNFSHGRLFGKEIQLPTHIELRVQFKDKSYEVKQDYSDFESL